MMRQQQPLDWDTFRNSSFLLTNMSSIMQKEEALLAFVLQKYAKFMFSSSGKTAIGCSLSPVIAVITLVFMILSLIGLLKKSRQLLNIYRCFCVCGLISSFYFFINFGMQCNSRLVDTTKWFARISFCAVFLLGLHCYLEQYESQAIFQ
ncbi:unnamed protein product, partial [Iphiclides podalirius]